MNIMYWTFACIYMEFISFINNQANSTENLCGITDVSFKLTFVDMILLFSLLSSGI